VTKFDSPNWLRSYETDFEESSVMQTVRFANWILVIINEWNQAKQKVLGAKKNRYANLTVCVTCEALND